MTDSGSDIGAPMAARGEHDRLCQAVLNDNDDTYFCICDFIAKVRADEKEKNKAEYVPVLMEHLRILADLRAKVEALKERVSVMVDERNAGLPAIWAIDEVLDLIDGSK